MLDIVSIIEPLSLFRYTASLTYWFNPATGKLRCFSASGNNWRLSVLHRSPHAASRYTIERYRRLKHVAFIMGYGDRL